MDVPVTAVDGSDPIPAEEGEGRTGPQSVESDDDPAEVDPEGTDESDDDADPEGDPIPPTGAGWDSPEGVGR